MFYYILLSAKPKTRIHHTSPLLKIMTNKQMSSFLSFWIFETKTLKSPLVQWVGGFQEAILFYFLITSEGEAKFASLVNMVLKDAEKV